MKRRIDSLAQRLGRIPTGWWVAFLTLPALLPLLRVGFFDSHDGLFHVYRLKALDQAVRAGVLYPRWFPDFAFGYGHPVLNFYSPLSYYWGLPFTLLGADAALATKFVFVTGLLASALGMYLFARLHTERLPALVAAVVYAYLPYHLIDLYIRGAVAEFLAFIWFPIVLWVFHRLVTDSAEQSFSRIAVASCPLTAMVITHSLSAFIFAPVLVAYVVILLARQRDLQALARVAVASALALTLSAFYWFPVLTESRFVGLGHGASQGYRDHLLPLTDLFSLSLAYPYPTDAGVTPTYPLGLVQGAILLAALTLPFLSYRRRWPVVFFLTLALCSAFMLTEASLPLWRIFEPGLALLQYPWRFQMLTVLATAFLAGALFDALSNAWHASFRTWARPLVAGCLLLTAAVWALWRLSIEPTTPDLSTEAMWRTDRKHGQVGATWTGEFLPIWVREQRWALSLPAPEPAPEGTVLPAGQVRLDRVGYNRYDVILDAPQGADLVLHQFHYPGWQAVGQVANYHPERSQGVPYDAQPEGDLGLAAFGVPPGSGPLSLRLELAPTQRWGTLISLVVALASSVTLVIQYQLRASTKPLLLAACFLLLAATLIAHLVLPHGYARRVTQVNANFEDTAELLAFTTDRTSYHPGETVSVSLYWRALRAPAQDYKTFIHLTDAAMTRQPAQHDGDPGGGFTPTTRWLPGELVPDTHHLLLPANLPPGRYRLWAGMYEYEPPRNLVVLSSDVQTTEGRVLLDEIEVVAP